MLNITEHTWPRDTMCREPREAETVYQVKACGWGVVGPEFRTEAEARAYASRVYPGEPITTGTVPLFAINDVTGPERA